MFKWYTTTKNIWWSKLDENKPSKFYFDSFNFEWIEIPKCPFGFRNQFQAYTTLENDKYTYFKRENTLTNEITYWFVDDKVKEMKNGCEYVLGLDIWASYNMSIFENLPLGFRIGVNRAHVPINNYTDANCLGVVDDLLQLPQNGYKIVERETLFNIRVSPETNQKLRVTCRAKTPNWSSERTFNFDGTFVNLKQYSTKCYVFSISVKGNNDAEFFVIPECECEGTNSITDITDNNKLFGNTFDALTTITKNQTARFLGIYNLPPLNWGIFNWYEEFSTQADSSGNRKYCCFGWYIGLNGTKYTTNRIEIGGNGALTLNKTNQELNTYAKINLNSNFYHNVISPNLAFVASGDNLWLNLGNYIAFSQGFLMQINSKDMISWGGQLQSNLQAYNNYLNSIREQMNTGIEMSRTASILGGVQSAINIGLGTGGAIAGGFSGDLSSTMKGVSQGVSGVFSLASSIINHQNTIRQYQAQLADAKNSVKVQFNNTAEKDLKLNLVIDNPVQTTPNWKDIKTVLVLNEYNGLTTRIVNDLTFLFGVKINSVIPVDLVKQVLNTPNNACVYLELQKDYVISRFSNYINRLFPKMNNTLKQVILDAWNVGYRIWNVECDLNNEYIINI